MDEKKFSSLAMIPSNFNANDNTKYSQSIKRLDSIIKGEAPLYGRNNDMRDDFSRDYTRILHSTAFRRLKHKTQVFYAPHNDHTCTRMEHALLVESVSKTIARALGLNTTLTDAISLGHDLGHAPFGHWGEECLNIIACNAAKLDPKKNKLFWHERNSLFFTDFVEMLPNTTGGTQHLDLTYAVRDGIICHCGEHDAKNGLVPRDDAIDLYNIKNPGSVMPYTWEGCVVRCSDIIAYLGRDIEDAKEYGIINDELLEKNGIPNKTQLINDLIVDLCKNSNPKDGICHSNEWSDKIDKIRTFCKVNIYENYRMLEFKKYAACVLDTLYNALINYYPTGQLNYCKELCNNFSIWCDQYNNNKSKFEAKGISSEESYQKCVIEYISGCSDMFAMNIHNQIISF